MNARTRGNEPRFDAVSSDGALPPAGVAFWANGEAVAALGAGAKSPLPSKLNRVSTSP